MSEAERILAHIEAGHTEVYPFCGACRQSKGAGPDVSGTRAIRWQGVPGSPDPAARVNDALSLSHSQHNIISHNFQP